MNKKLSMGGMEAADESAAADSSRNITLKQGAVVQFTAGDHVGKRGVIIEFVQVRSYGKRGR